MNITITIQDSKILPNSLQIHYLQISMMTMIIQEKIFIPLIDPLLFPSQNQHHQHIIKTTQKHFDWLEYMNYSKYCQVWWCPLQKATHSDYCIHHRCKRSIEGCCLQRHLPGKNYCYHHSSFEETDKRLSHLKNNKTFWK